MSVRLVQACCEGKLDNLKRILSSHSYLLNELVDDLGGTPLGVASRCNQDGIVVYLLSLSNIDPNKGNEARETTPLMWASEAGYVEIVASLLNHPSIDVNKQRLDRSSALHGAALENKSDVIKQLLARPDINVNLIDQEGRTALHLASVRGFTEVVELLLAHPSTDTTLKTKNGKSAADLCTDTPSIRRMIDTRTRAIASQAAEKAAPAKKAGDRYIKADLKHSLVTALCGNQLKTVQDIIVAYPEIIHEEVENTLGTPLAVAGSQSNAGVVTYLLSLPNIDVNKGDTKVGYTPLMRAIYNDKLESIDLLLKRNDLEINKQAKNGWSVLHFACFYNKRDAVSLILQGRPDANINLKDTKGDAPLHKAAWKGYFEIVQVLVAHPTTDILPRNDLGDTPLSICCTEEKADRAQRPKIRQLLELEGNNRKPAIIEKSPMMATMRQKTLPGQRISLGAKAANPVPSTDRDLNLETCIEENIAKWNRIKLMVVGSGRAGKTSLIRSLTGQKFDEKLVSTIGIDEITCDVQDVGVTLSKEGEAVALDSIWSPLQGRLKLLEASIARQLKLKDPVKQNRLKVTASQSNKASDLSEKSIHRASVVPTGFETSSGITPVRRFQQNEDLSYETSINKDKARKLKLNEVDTQQLKKYLTVPSPPVQVVGAVDGAARTAERVPEAQDCNQPLSSQYIISIFDYGGQSIFKVIHPFLLTKGGVYVLVFDMSLLLPTASEALRNDCLDEIHFWLNSVMLHSYDRTRREMAPLVLVGTRKDVVPDEKDHEEISKLLFTRFHSYSAWNYIVSNQQGRGIKGNTNFCFFPIDNTKGGGDTLMKELFKALQETVESSEYLNLELPLIWLKVMDALLSGGKSFITYEEVHSIGQSNGLSEKSTDCILQFMHDTGLLMWHDEETLRDIVILDPVNYFVRPVTTIVCKHSQTESDTDATWHLLPIHKLCQKRFVDEWALMTQCGFISNELMQALLKEFPQRENILKLMRKFGLVLDLVDKRTFTSVPGFLVPALLPLVIDTRFASVKSMDSFVCFYFGFYISHWLEEETFVTREKMMKHGFLPTGFFDRLLCRLINACMEAQMAMPGTGSSGASDWKKNISRTTAVLTYKGQQFIVTHHQRENLLQVEVLEPNPIPIYLIVLNNIMVLCNECYQDLRVITLLDESSSSSSLGSKRGLLCLHRVEAAVALNKSSSIFPDIQKLKKEYNLWLYQFKQSLALSNYDVFISYRWNDNQDSVLVSSLFDQFLYHNFSTRCYAPVSVFLDRKRLQDGENFKEEFASALLNSRIVVPIITVDALNRMIYHNPDVVDNLLLEWILALHLQMEKKDSKSRGKKDGSGTSSSDFPKLLPVVFGSVEYDRKTQMLRKLNSITDPHELKVWDALSRTQITLPEKSILKALSEIRPKKTLELAEKLLNGGSLSVELKSMSVANIVCRLLDFNSQMYVSDPSKYPLPMKISALTSEFSEYIVQVLTGNSLWEEVLPMDAMDVANLLLSQKLISPEDYYFYNVSSVASLPIPVPTSPPSTTAVATPFPPLSPSTERNPSTTASTFSAVGDASGAIAELSFEDQLRCLGLNDRIVSTLCLLGVESMEDLSYFYNNEDLMKQMKDKLKALDFAKFKDAKNKVCV